MFKKNKKQEVNLNNNVKVKFVIPQIAESYEGIRTSKGYFKKKEFASSLYGTGIKDISTYHDNALEGIDINRTYDSFRSEEDKKIKEEEYLKKYGTRFPEFQQININTAEEVYGEKITINKKKNEQERKAPVSFNFIKNKEDIAPKKPVINEPVVKENTEEVKKDDEPIVSGFDFSIDSLVDSKESDISTFEPVVEINEIEDVDFFKEEKKEVKFSNIVKRSKEEMAEIYAKNDELYAKANAAKEDDKVALNTINNAYEHKEEPKPNTVVNEVKEPTNDKPGFKMPEVVNNYGTYILPPIDRFKRTDVEDLEIPGWVEEKKEIINETLTSFGLSGEVVTFKKGPTFTRFEVLLQTGVNVRKIVNLQDTFQANLGVKTIRIQAPIPGKRTVGIEVPNDKTQTVWFGDIITDEFVRDGNPLNVALGKDIDGNIITSDITKWPHGLVGGATNSGKSVCINTILVSLLLKNKPDDLKLILVDPKQVELITYNDLPHLITPVISDPKMASHALKWAVEEMERRYTCFSNNRVRNIKDYNEKVKEDPTLQKMSYVIIVIDELADLMQVCGSDVEESIQRITQKARAAGIHLIVATQRPTVDVVKGTIKANIPARLAFRVFSQTDSFTILDEGGAETLLGKGDMLLKEIDLPKRLQGAYIPDKEIDYVTDYIKKESKPDYLFDHSDLKNKFESESFAGTQTNSESPEMLYQCAKFVIENESCSINLLQQQFSLGFNRASRIVTALEELGIVSGKSGTKGREILVTLAELDEIFEK